MGARYAGGPGGQQGGGGERPAHEKAGQPMILTRKPCGGQGDGVPRPEAPMIPRGASRLAGRWQQGRRPGYPEAEVTCTRALADMHRNRRLPRRGVGMRAALFLALVVPSAAGAVGPPERPPNIFIFLADDQILKSNGCYGASPSHTPHVDQLAREGMLFTNCYAPSAICSPNRAALLSGMYPLRNGCHANHSGFYDGIKSLPNYMRELGYRCCIVDKDGIQKPSDCYAWERRIEKSGEHVAGADTPSQDRHRVPRYEEIERFLTEQDDRPFVLFHACSLPHQPSLSRLPNGLEGYAASNATMDEQLGRDLALLEKHGLVDRTVVMFMNDNEAQSPLTKDFLYERSLRVPLVIRWPGRIGPGTVATATVSTMDVLPTLMEIAGGATPPGIDGRSMLDVWQGKADRFRDEMFASVTGVIVSTGGRQETPYPMRSCRSGNYKYIRNINHEVPHFIRTSVRLPFEELYDLAADPEERANLAADPRFAAVKRELSDKVDAWMAYCRDEGIESELESLRRYPAKAQGDRR